MPDDAKQLLRAIALNLEADQTRREQIKKSKGFAGLPAHSAALEHGALRELYDAKCQAKLKTLRGNVWHQMKHTTVHWVLHASNAIGLLKLQPESEERQIPHEDEVITRPFLVDSASNSPIPMRTVQCVVEEPLSDTQSVVVVVARIAANEKTSASLSAS